MSMAAGYAVFLCCIGKAISNTPSGTSNTTTSHMMDDATFYPILFGTGFALMILFAGCLTIACIRIRKVIHSSLHYNLRAASLATYDSRDRITQSQSSIRRAHPNRVVRVTEEEVYPETEPVITQPF